MTQPPFRFAVSATFTAEPIQPVIDFWGRRLNTAFEVCFAPYNQPLQTMLDPTGVFAANQHGVNLLLLRPQDLAQFELGNAEALARIEANANELIHVVRDSARRLSVPVLVTTCPASPAFTGDPERARLQRELAARFAAVLDEVPGVQFISCEQIERFYPVEDPHDPAAEKLGRIPYSEMYFAALGTALVRHAHALFTPPYKVIALDCDNTLWQGICGEDGPSGIVIDPARRALQSFMLDQREAGMLLTLASKNNEPDVLETFAANPQMPLELRHFAGRRLNWDSKAENLASLAGELSLGLDSFIFVDDNPKECAEVGENVPEVLALPLPADLRRIPEFLHHVWAFDHPVVTEEDRNRNAYYAQAQQFGSEIKQATNLEEFMSSLRVDVHILPLGAERVSRVAQLTQRTNQFNFTTVRRSEVEIQSLSAQGLECYTVEVDDRFGSYGLVGVLVLRREADGLEIDTLLLSCRVLGRGVEHRMLSWVAEEALHRGLPGVVARLSITRKNQPAQQFLAAIEGAEVRGLNGGFVYRFAAERLRTLTWTAAASVAAPGLQPTAAAAGARRSIDYAAIACELPAPAQILEAMRRESRSGTVAPEPGAMTATEGKLAALWSELLKRPSVAVADNFFDIGGHSLMAVLMIVRVREAFGVELPIDDVYSSTLTLGELARRIEAHQTGGMDPDEYRALLAEIESLSDDEVQALLAKEDPAACESC